MGGAATAALEATPARGLRRLGRLLAADHETLLDADRDRVAASFRGAARFLATTSAEKFLTTVLAEPHRIRTILSLISELDHVGFMAPAESDAVIGPAARAAGFDVKQRTFPSTILARELGDLAGRGEVPTTIFKAQGELPGGAPGTVEVAIPHEVDDEIVRGWIRRGIGAHVAFRIESPSSFPDLKRMMESEGFRIPRSMNGEALRNPVEGVTAVFFDRRPARLLGLEFCHYD